MFWDKNVKQGKIISQAMRNCVLFERLSKG